MIAQASSSAALCLANQFTRCDAELSNRDRPHVSWWGTELNLGQHDSRMGVLRFMEPQELGRAGNGQRNRIARHSGNGLPVRGTKVICALEDIAGG
jgi:hypothetical protein